MIKWLLVAIVVLFIASTINPMAYWSLVSIARTLFVLCVGIAIGYFWAKTSG